MSPTSTSRRTTAKTDSSVLSREALIDRALALADQEGLDAVSIRRIAQDFGVTPMALYWHVKNKDELLAAMGDRMLDAAIVPEPGRRDLEHLRALMTVLVNALSAHPGSAELAQLRVLRSETGLELSEQALDILRHCGFSVQQSAHLARACLQTAIMLVTGRPGAETQTPQDERAALLMAKQAALTSLPPDRFPQLIEHAAALIDCDDEISYYQGGVDLFIAGVQALQQQLPSRT